jgi:hypothetical protein
LSERTVDRAIQAGIGKRAWQVLAVIALHADDNGKAYPSLATVSKKTGIGRQDLPRIIAELVGASLITRKHNGATYKGRLVNLYQIVMEGAGPTVCSDADSSDADSGVTDSLQALATVCSQAYQTDQINKPSSGANAPSESAQVRKRRGTRLPDDWQPSEVLCKFARDQGLDPDEVAAEFRDYWIGLPDNDRRSRKADWDATFRNRCRAKRDQARGKILPFRPAASGNAAATGTDQERLERFMSNRRGEAA